MRVLMSFLCRCCGNVCFWVRFRLNSDYFSKSSSFAFLYSERKVSSCSFRYLLRNSSNVCVIIAPHFYFIGIAGFEPTRQGVKVLCLTTWLYSIIIVWRKVESNHRHTGLQPAALPDWAIAPMRVLLTHLVPYVGEPYNQEVFERQPGTVRLICSRILLLRNCTSEVKGFYTCGGICTRKPAIFWGDR